VSLLSEQETVKRERQKFPGRAWQKPTGAQFEILPKPKHAYLLKTYSTLPIIEKKPPHRIDTIQCTVTIITTVTSTVNNGQSCRALDQ